MTKVVSLDCIEKAFDEVLISLDVVERIIEEHIEIEINEMKLAQVEKIHYIRQRMNKLEMNKSDSYLPVYKLAMGR
ncbi:hypothetical protein ACFSCX_18455 [Bacillus salitolerans]|uniref:Uncharacterized protein n=1 Tax=Bacillus salitolerans TaxID=1437434 RepID=A0ABW4LVR5_9BACI